MGMTQTIERVHQGVGRRKPGWLLLKGLLVIASYLLLASPASAQTDPTQLVQQFRDAFNRHDAAGVAALFTADATYQGGSCRTFPNQTCVGQAAIQKAWAVTFASQPDFHLTDIGTPQVSGDAVTTSIEVTSSVVRKAGVDRYINIRVWQVQNDKIAAAHVKFDTTDAQTTQYVAFTQAQSAAALPRSGEPTVPLSAELGVGILLLSLGLALRRARPA